MGTCQTQPRISSRALHSVGPRGTAPAASVPRPGVAPETCFVAVEGMVTDGGLREQEVRHSETRGRGWRSCNTRPQKPATQARTGSRTRHPGSSLQSVVSTARPLPASSGCCPHGHRHPRGTGVGPESRQPTVQCNFPPSRHQEQPPRAPELLARGGAGNLFRRRSERLTSATAAHGGQGVRQVDPRVSRSRPARTSGPSDHDSDGRQTTASGRPTAAQLVGPVFEECTTAKQLKLLCAV